MHFFFFTSFFSCKTQWMKEQSFTPSWRAFNFTAVLTVKSFILQASETNVNVLNVSYVSFKRLEDKKKPTPVRGQMWEGCSYEDRELKPLAAAMNCPCHPLMACFMLRLGGSVIRNSEYCVWWWGSTAFTLYSIIISAQLNCTLSYALNINGFRCVSDLVVDWLCQAVSPENSYSQIKKWYFTQPFLDLLV